MADRPDIEGMQTRRFTTSPPGSIRYYSSLQPEEVDSLFVYVEALEARVAELEREAEPLRFLEGQTQAWFVTSDDLGVKLEVRDRMAFGKSLTECVTMIQSKLREDADSDE